MTRISTEPQSHKDTKGKSFPSVESVKSVVKPGRIHHMLQCRRLWEKFEPKFEQARTASAQLGIFQREAAFSHFLGGCSVELETNGGISKAQFVRLLEAATEFGKRVKV